MRASFAGLVPQLLSKVQVIFGSTTNVSASPNFGIAVQSPVPGATINEFSVLASEVLLAYHVAMKQKHYPTMRGLLWASSAAVPRQALLSSVVLFLLVLLPFGQLGVARGADYNGQVVDAETGKPIEGAVVVVEWHKKPRISISDINYFHNARETLTGADGKFMLDSSPGTDWNPLTYIQVPRIVVFYPGYRPFTPTHPEDIGIGGGLNEIAEAFERGVVVKLAHLQTEKEQRAITNKSGAGSIRAPYALLPNFLRLINIQRKNVGMKELQFP